MTVARGSKEVALSKARGASSGRLALRHAGQVAAVILLFGGLGALAGAAAGHGSMLDLATWRGVAAEALLGALVVGALVYRHTDRVVSQRQEVVGGTGWRAATGGIARDVGVLLAAAFATFVYRVSGTGDTVGSIDWLAVAAPPLLALAAGTAVVRLAPALLGPAAALARRGRGAVGFLGTTLARRRVRLVAAPLTGLVIVVAAGMFAAGFDASVVARVRADALRQTGADARVEFANDDVLATGATEANLALDPALPAAAARLRGVTGTATAWVTAADAQFQPADFGQALVLIAVDAESFRKLADTTAAEGSGQVSRIPAAWPADPGAARAVSALVSPNLKDVVGSTGGVQFRGYSAQLAYTAAADIPAADSVYAKYGTAYAIVPLSQLEQNAVQVQTGTPLAQTARPTVAWLSGDPEEAQLRELPGIGTNYTISVLKQVRAAGFGSGQVAAGRDVFRLVEALCLGFYGLCLLLLIAATRRAARDSALLARVFGLSVGRSRALSVLVPLPMAGAAVAGGAGIGLALAPLLGPLIRGAGAGFDGHGSILATGSVGVGWAVAPVMVALGIAAAGILLDLLLWRGAELSVRLRGAEYE
jgi:putative ABC transport system permease protein